MSYEEIVADCLHYLGIALLLKVLQLVGFFVWGVAHGQHSHIFVPWPTFDIGIVFFTAHLVHNANEEKWFEMGFMIFGFICFLIYTLVYVWKAYSNEPRNKVYMVVLLPIAHIASISVFLAFPDYVMTRATLVINALTYASVSCKIPFMLRTKNFNEIPHHVNFYLVLIAINGTLHALIKEKWLALTFDLIDFGIAMLNIMAYYLFKEAYDYMPKKLRGKEIDEVTQEGLAPVILEIRNAERAQIKKAKGEEEED